MKIKVYIVTYKKNDVLNENLRTLWNATKHPENIEVTIVANHPDLVIDDENKRDNLRVVFNTTRMPHAWGYLSRDWNYCILDCFKTWQNPDNADWLVMAQNDVTWVEGWDEWLANNKSYDLISQPVGDQSLCLNINAVKTVGFFDERFTTLHYHEFDYFIRALLLMKERTSINDVNPNCRHSNNHIGNVITNTSCSAPATFDENLHNRTHWASSHHFASEKWGAEINSIDTKYITKHRKKMLKLCQNEIDWYPFFWDKYPNHFKYTYSLPDLKKCPLYKRILSCLVPSKKIRRIIRGES